MKTIFMTALGLLFAGSLSADYTVNEFGDSGGGTLRTALADACKIPGDDEINFAHSTSPEVRISLRSPLVIPEECEGGVTLAGLSDQEVILDGSNIDGGQGILIVRSWGNVISRLTLVGYADGAGLVLQDGDNIIEDNSIGVYRGQTTAAPNQTGVLVFSDWNIFTGNTISANLGEGVRLVGNANTLEGNRIGECEVPCEGKDSSSPPFPTFVREIVHEAFETPEEGGPDDDGGSVDCGNGGAGVRIAGDRNLIGGDEIEEGNRILHNNGAGIMIETTGVRNRFSRNVIESNGRGDIELQGDANNGIEPLKSLQAFPVEGEPPDGRYRYTLFGEGESGTTVELYRVPEESAGTSCGSTYLESFAVSGEFFSYTLERDDLPPGSWIAAIVCDEAGNCSEFSEKAAPGRDLDHDGLLDPTEDPDGDLVVDEGESDPLENDSDGDGLPDPVEDRNQNGTLDLGETDPAAQDTDDDGISDFVETGGDGRFDPADRDTDPRDSDTDGDGVADGDEDVNADGVIVLGESDPLEAGL